MIARKTFVEWCVVLTMVSGSLRAEEINLREAVLVVPSALTPVEHTAVVMLEDEAARRTTFRWEISTRWPEETRPVIALASSSSWKVLTEFFGDKVPPAASSPAEGFKIFIRKDLRGAPVVFVLGNDARGLLFGAGRLLREMHLSRGKSTLAANFNIQTSPHFSIRGHQLGYRPKTNSYDGWDLGLWERYIRDLAVFGTNAVELIPPRSDDDDDSPHFPLPPMEMMIGMSRLLDQYGMDVWIWYPAMDRDYSVANTVDLALKEWGEVFKKLPRVDAVFVPGGDPGHSHPRVLLDLLEKQTVNLHKYHPRAKMWVSPQSFTQEWLEEFLSILQKEQPAWLGGIVFGPQVRIPLPELRRRIPAKYPLRRYPDITHSLRCQYPVSDWDVAFALTEGRECINPRPVDQARIFRIYQEESAGFISYSEGCNDDVNKMIWSSLGWDPEMSVEDILRQYSRYFIGDRYAEDFAQGLLALERNWRGPLLSNDSVYTTLRQFQTMEKSAGPPVLLNWRFQQGLYRAYFDAYVRSRLLYETELEERACDKLRQAKAVGSLVAMRQAEAILERADTERVSPEWRARVFELGEALFQSIRMQLSVGRYKAIAVGRGANLDTVDYPLNNRFWCQKRFADIRKLDLESQRLREIDAVVNWTDPGPGGFYDDLGNPSRQPHLVRGAGYKKDPGFYQSSAVGFHPDAEERVSWATHAESFYDAPLIMKYDGLDTKASYTLKVVYAGDTFRPRVRLVANESVEIHPFQRKEQPLRAIEFDLPFSLTSKGGLTLQWTQERGRGGNGHGCQIAEVWLIKK